MAARIHLVNPSRTTFGTAVITPRWLFVLAAASGTEWGDPHIVDESLERLDLSTIARGDVVGIGKPVGSAVAAQQVDRILKRPRGRTRIPASLQE